MQLTPNTLADIPVNRCKTLQQMCGGPRCSINMTTVNIQPAGTSSILDRKPCCLQGARVLAGEAVAGGLARAFCGP